VDEVNGEGNYIDFKYRGHNPRLGRFFAVDPVAKNYPWNSSYAFAENKLGLGREIEGLEIFIGWFDVVLATDASRLTIPNVETITNTVKPAAEALKPAIDPLQRGRATETQVLDRLGLEKNTKPTTVNDPKTGGETTTIPDAVRPNGQTVEIKDVRYQSLTRQLRAQEKMSQESGQKPQLFVPENAKVSKPLEQSSFEIQRYNIAQPDNTNVKIPMVMPSLSIQPSTVPVTSEPQCTNCL
jgi:hypothetical protein